MLCVDSLFSNDEEDEEDDLLDTGLGPHHHHPSLSPGNTSLPGMMTPTKGVGSLSGPHDTDVRTPINSSGDNSNPDKDTVGDSDVRKMHFFRP